MKNKRTWKQWKEDVGNLPMFKEDRDAFLIVLMFFILFTVLFFLTPINLQQYSTYPFIGR